MEGRGRREGRGGRDEQLERRRKGGREGERREGRREGEMEGEKVGREAKRMMT